MIALLAIVPAIKMIAMAAIPFALMGAVSWAWNVAASSGAATVEIERLSDINEQNRKARVRSEANAQVVFEQSQLLAEKLKGAELRVQAVQARLDTIPKAGVGETCPIDCVIPSKWLENESEKGKDYAPITQ